MPRNLTLDRHTPDLIVFADDVSDASVFDAPFYYADATLAMRVTEHVGAEEERYEGVLGIHRIGDAVFHVLWVHVRCGLIGALEWRFCCQIK